MNGIVLALSLIGGGVTGYSVEANSIAPSGPYIETRRYRFTFQAGAEWPNMLFRANTPWNWTGVGALVMDIRNPGKSPLAIGIRIDDRANADGWVGSRTSTVTLAPRESKSVHVMFKDPMAWGMRALPSAPSLALLPSTGAGPIDQSHIVAFQIFSHLPSAALPIEVSNLRTVSEYGLPLKGVVDEFGQFSESRWPGKVQSLQALLESEAQEQAYLASVVPNPDLDRFGGYTPGPQLNATGYFRTQKVGTQWWLVDPDGRLFFSHGVDTVVPNEATMTTGRERLFRWLPAATDPLGQFRVHVDSVHSGPVASGDAYMFYRANIERRYGADAETKWRGRAIDRLRDWGFNTLGNWSDWAFYRNGRMPYVATADNWGDHARVSSGSDYWGQMHDPFDPKFADTVRTRIGLIAPQVKDDPYCIGYFVDNELSWSGPGEDGRYGLALGALKAPAGSPAKAEFVRVLRQKYVTIGALNQAWGTSISSWSVLDTPFELAGSLNAQSRLDSADFVYRLAKKYFEVINAELTRVDPHHLYLGCRFAWRNPDAERAASEVCDVVSFNLYGEQLNRPDFAAIESLDVPCIIGEFHFGSLDRGMFHTGLVAAQDQADRGRKYGAYVTSVLQHPSFVGCHWFQYADEPLTGRSFDGENYNIGLVSITDTPYTELVSAAKAIHRTGYSNRLGLGRER